MRDYRFMSASFFLGFVSLASSKEFDFLIFTQFWPQSDCDNWKEMSANNACNLKHDTRWTIHGLWPTRNDEIGPLNCNASRHFNPKDIKDLVPQLLVQWPQIRYEKDIYKLWKHEYNKHGTCAAVLSQTNTPHKYFKKSLDLNLKYDIVKFLNEREIYPGGKYSLQKILDAITLGLSGHKPGIKCLKSKKSHEYYIDQVMVCLDKSFGIMDCDRLHGGPVQGCIDGTHGQINYPLPTGHSSSVGYWFGIIFFIAILIAVGYFLYKKYYTHFRYSQYDSIN